MEHTPTPLSFEVHQSTGNVSIQHNGFGIATVFANRVDDPVAVAREIIQAVNSHDALVDALEYILGLALDTLKNATTKRE